MDQRSSHVIGSFILVRSKLLRISVRPMHEKEICPVITGLKVRVYIGYVRGTAALARFDCLMKKQTLFRSTYDLF